MRNDIRVAMPLEDEAARLLLLLGGEDLHAARALLGARRELEGPDMNLVALERRDRIDVEQRGGAPH
ncbi:MAG TPA: hypothetical protein VG994_06960 [Steroidobacteraceae bacterium]|nr:hypothetical protein [Steroidobacteraceae bacterium]